LQSNDVLLRRYEPLPNDSLGNYQENSRSQQNSNASGGMSSESFSLLNDISNNRDVFVGPNPSNTALEIVTLLMDALQNTSNPQQALELCFLFASDQCRAATGGSFENFVKYTNNPTFGSLVHCQDWQVLSVGPIIPGSTHRGDMQTVLIKITKPLTVQAAIDTKLAEDRKTGRRRPTIQERMRARQQRQLHTEDDVDGDHDHVDVMEPDEEGKKTFLWTLKKERRPPRQGCWLVHEVLYKRNAFLQTK
jgi:hypothetical protein